MFGGTKDDQPSLWAAFGPAPVAPVALPDPARLGSLLAIAGHQLVAVPEGGLYWPEHRLLAVADLHLEKGSAFARRRQLLPPYDTTVTLQRLSALVARLQPRVVVALGDSFHDGGGPGRLTAENAATLAALQRGRDWLWVAGNHDPDLPASVGGERLGVLGLSGLTFRHEPTAGAAAGEIAGHLHPAARVAGRAGVVRRRCFVGDGSRAVLPAFGAYTGGLNVLEAAFRPIFSGMFHAFVLGAEAVYPIPRRRLARG